MKINKVMMPKEKAKKLWREYCQTLKTRENDYLRDIKEIKACYYQLSKGRPIINIIDVFKKFGYAENGTPILAFAPARERFVWFRQTNWEGKRGDGYFTTEGNSWNRDYKILLELTKIFPSIDKPDRTLKTAVPVIPPKFLPKKLTKCYLLWEVESWEEARPKRDPILLKKISGNLYAILACWNMSKVEAMIMSGRT